MIQVYNTLTHEKEPLKPIKDNHIGIYVCGMTVYDHCHMGHARVLVAFDMIVRYLRAREFSVTYVRNITDIDDKIIHRAEDLGLSITELTDKFIFSMHEDADKLGVLRPDFEPRATQNIEAMQEMIQKLLDKEIAYQADNGDIYYDVTRFEGYGKLSRKSLDDLKAGARVEVISSKRHPLDFVLWKSAKPDEPNWSSPWGNGRPGWHIECSAMSTEVLGNTFDIHGGGFDLQFPHHENEIAQSEAATGCSFVNTWMHVGFVQVNNEKMSKSLGNFFTIKEVFELYQPEVVRFFMLSSHYRSPLNYSEVSLEQAEHSLRRLYLALRNAPEVSDDEEPDMYYFDSFHAAMEDDFNTPEAMAVLFELAREINKAKENDTSNVGQLAATLRLLANTVGLLYSDPEDFLQGAGSQANAEYTAERIQSLIEVRNLARQNKDWLTADRIRDELLDVGITLDDSAEGTTWRKS